MTVSRVINSEGNVRQATLERVRQAIERLGYAPNEAARSLAGAASLQIGILYDNLSSAYLGELLLGALEEAGKVGAQLAVRKSGGPDTERDAIAKLLKSGVDGVILPPSLSESSWALEMLSDEGVPAVCLATGGTKTGSHSVRIDDFEAARSMTRYLIGWGHRAIGFVKGHPGATASAERLRGFSAALEEAGIMPDKCWIAQGYSTYQSGLRAAEKIMAQQPRPTAIFASNDDMAAAVSAVAHRMGLDVPGDLSVAGFDDTQLAVTIHPELTTICQPIAEMARKSVDILHKAVRDARKGNPPSPVHLLQPYTLIERGSVARPMTMDHGDE